MSPLNVIKCPVTSNQISVRTNPIEVPHKMLGPLFGVCGISSTCRQLKHVEKISLWSVGDGCRVYSCSLRSTIGGVMPFYVVHTCISYAVISICAQTRLCSKKRKMTREGVDLDMKLPSSSMKTNSP